MDPSGDPALFSSLSATVGKTINEYVGFYVGQLRYRFQRRTRTWIRAVTLRCSLSATVGKTINEYAGGNVKDWVKAIDRALKWDADAERIHV